MKCEGRKTLQSKAFSQLSSCLILRNEQATMAYEKSLQHERGKKKKNEKKDPKENINTLGNKR